ncbi:hypothetical protein P280DRAFT_465791 [Massarina eburnea CBS 473.64]|uniref:Multicopper oxidase n=1 Tax=Massarina eburnea CBS 473.64 TaxID=1395130 RepID=A0A6A6SA49_9PLEO|nr:hypothetical protein P280DRAFT_465791 [Massarina eburnea CBS 473.64]
MGFLSYSIVYLLALTGIPLVSSLSVPNRFKPRDASPGFTCHIPDGFEFCNSESNRQCWLRNKATGKEYNIHTDYEDDFPEGIERTYNLEVTEADVSPDGFVKRAQVIKRVEEATARYPGVLIEACWGDTLVVNVKNKLSSNGTTIHWHGIRMFEQNQMDGVNGVTQCPISQDDTFQYKFHLRQYGHTWYHSHYSSQYTDGVAGPLLIHGPHTASWDVEWEPIIIADWFHTNAYEAFTKSLSGPPGADSLVVNGTGRDNIKGTGDYFRQTFEHDQRHLIRIINGGTDFHFHFSIDGHMLQVVSADLVPIVPFWTDSLSVGIGQRYSVIVHANATTSSNGKYWMRAEYNTTNLCNLNQENFPASEPDTQRVGIITYSNCKAPATEEPSTERWPAIVGCQDPVFEPKIPWTVTAPQNSIIKNAHFAGLDLRNQSHGAYRWELLEEPLWLNYSDPTIKNLKNTTWNSDYAIQPYNYDDPEGFVYMIINSGGSTHALGGAHPIHLHGHDFAVISQGPGILNPANPPKWNTKNPPRRDVAMLPDSGHLVIAFKTDNPGVWLMHCHIAWHAGSGLALQVLEKQEKIASTLGSLSAIDQGCEKWTDWMSQHPDKFRYEDQEDSGI